MRGLRTIPEMNFSDTSHETPHKNLVVKRASCAVQRSAALAQSFARLSVRLVVRECIPVVVCAACRERSADKGRVDERQSFEEKVLSKTSEHISWPGNDL